MKPVSSWIKNMYDQNAYRVLKLQKGFHLPLYICTSPHTLTHLKVHLYNLHVDEELRIPFQIVFVALYICFLSGCQLGEYLVRWIYSLGTLEIVAKFLYKFLMNFISFVMYIQT